MKGVKRLIIGVLTLLLIVSSMPLTTFRSYANDNTDDKIIYGSGWEFFYEATDQRSNGYFCYEAGNTKKETR